ncbi:carboxypeptidase-like regulatory domain-containing protein [Adhaeribacter rhizoryzae]|uniref:Carboxypeptidase regulatory-like domain-containing protein n=1 Tax=Adhaeribacter rhizoryzae TaxID=2607907 RepID=A0A5M6D1U4_9BACT|nr:carboxypeptidase-like regulatory domain-containing protein [Adhaeribacter rhizoryzae]KAA5541303.1 carboxypeptidase regulatory-like domain-containing protein [Adhaeribacter rhizoryzae]
MRTFIFTKHNYLLSAANRSTFAGATPEKHKTLKNISAAENSRVKTTCLGIIFWLLAITGLVTTGNVFAQNLSATFPNANQALSPNHKTLVNKGKIIGQIVDEATGRPITFASLTLEDQNTGKIINHLVSDRDGRFLADQLTNGKYRLFVDYLSYGTTVIDGLLVDNGEVNIGNIGLIADAQALTQVLTACDKD